MDSFQIVVTGLLAALIAVIGISMTSSGSAADPLGKPGPVQPTAQPTAWISDGGPTGE